LNLPTYHPLKAAIMDVEIDQSGRIEYTKHATALALSDGISFSLLIPATVKRACIRTLRRQGLTGPTFYVQLFATGLFFLLKDHIEVLTQVVIDVEYTGKETQIKEHLINLLRRAGREVEPWKIQFQQIGKKSPAHELALDTFRGDREPDIVLTQEDILGEFRKQK